MSAFRLLTWANLRHIAANGRSSLCAAGNSQISLARLVDSAKDSRKTVALGAAAASAAKS
jgi:hypothetical protein